MFRRFPWIICGSLTYKKGKQITIVEIERLKELLNTHFKNSSKPLSQDQFRPNGQQNHYGIPSSVEFKNEWLCPWKTIVYLFPIT